VNGGVLAVGVIEEKAMIEKIIELNLTAEEKTALQNSAKIYKEAISDASKAIGL